MLTKSSSYLNKFSCKENVDSVRILNLDRQVKVTWYSYLHTVIADGRCYSKLMLEVCLPTPALWTYVRHFRVFYYAALTINVKET